MTFITVLHIFTCILLVLVVLIQQGKGAEISASFGGSSQTVFGSSGGANFFTRLTQGAAAVFMLTSLVITLLQAPRKSLFEGSAAAPAATTAPAVPAQPVAPAAPVGSQKDPVSAAPKHLSRPAFASHLHGQTEFVTHLA